MKKSLNKNFADAKRNKKDEFYTQLTDIEKELKYYKKHFMGKVVFCNCDDPVESNFYKYFSLNFDVLGLKELITTHFNYKKPTYRLSCLKRDGKLESKKTPLRQNGDFRSPESIQLLKYADIVVTNPPFSLFREYVEQLVNLDTEFLILGNQNAITYKEIFKLIKNNVIWAGVDNGGTKWFKVPSDYSIKTESRQKIVDGQKYISMGSVYWFTNLDIQKRHEDLTLYREYDSKYYPKYDNFDAINVDRVSEIPLDYKGMMGVPITFINKYNPDQFDILGIDRSLVEQATGKVSRFLLDGREVYARVVVVNKKLL